MVFYRGTDAFGEVPAPGEKTADNRMVHPEQPVLFLDQGGLRRHPISRRRAYSPLFHEHADEIQREFPDIVQKTKRQERPRVLGIVIPGEPFRADRHEIRMRPERGGIVTRLCSEFFQDSRKSAAYRDTPHLVESQKHDREPEVVDLPRNSIIGGIDLMSIWETSTGSDEAISAISFELALGSEVI